MEGTAPARTPGRSGGGMWESERERDSRCVTGSPQARHRALSACSPVRASLGHRGGSEPLTLYAASSLIREGLSEEVALSWRGVRAAGARREQRRG